MEKEEWKDVAGYEDYFMVSNIGNIWSKRTSRYLKTVKAKTGYIIFSSRIGGREGKSVCLRIHRLVAEAFLPAPEEYMKEWAESTYYKRVQVNHKDGDKLNNNVRNLEWCTNEENQLHSLHVLGNKKNKPRGEDCYTAKLSEQSVRYILIHYKPRCREFGSRALGRKFNIDHMQILRVVKREIWAHIEV